MSDEAKQLAASIRARLANRAREQGRPFQEVLQYYAIERFLYRLAKSEHGENFVLKGGVVFFGWHIPLRRPTRDIDLHGYSPSTVENLEGIVMDICGQPVEADGMLFNADSVQGEVIQSQAEYEGIRLRFIAFLGTARVHMQIDVGFSDVLVPPAITLDYPTLLEMPEPRLRAYTWESLIAEKLQAMVFLGSVNSRMKDFYDVWLLAQETTIGGAAMHQAVLTTFKNRNTPVPDDIPVCLSDSFAREKQRQWRAFIQRDDVDVEPDLTKIVSVLREFLLPLLEAARDEVDFASTWEPGKHWT